MTMEVVPAALIAQSAVVDPRVSSPLMSPAYIRFKSGRCICAATLAQKAAQRSDLTSSSTYRLRQKVLL